MPGTSKNASLGASREYDIFIYGASGYTARFVINELESTSYKVLLGARDPSKIQRTLFPMIKCSLSEIGSLAAKAAILVNCAGPYAETADEIISCCISSNTHYIDICGEPSVIGEIFRKYQDEAAVSKTRIVQACGFDSVPADIGAFYISQFFDQAVVESRLELKANHINTGTWNSLLLSFRNYRNTYVCKEPASKNKEKQKLKEYFYDNGAYYVLFRSSDPFVVKRSIEYYRTKNMCSLKYQGYLKIGSLLNLILYYLLMLMISKLSRYSYFFDLFKHHPRFFSMGIVKDLSRECKGPKNDEASFKMTFTATGHNSKLSASLSANTKGPENKILIINKTLVITGPEPGYVATAIILAESAKILMEESSSAKLAFGVLTPAMCFGKTRLVERLNDRGIKFEIK
ncbi:hypothetical protein ENBRE01_0407 [Enteropsectra breve]|nr:hypothetical protein ENBRE01_0407 [Enteropsectra breve]